MVKTEIKRICIRINIKNSKRPKKLNAELKKLKEFVSKSDVFKGKKRKTNKIISSFMVKEK